MIHGYLQTRKRAGVPLLLASWAVLGLLGLGGALPAFAHGAARTRRAT